MTKGMYSFYRLLSVGKWRPLFIWIAMCVLLLVIISVFSIFFTDVPLEHVIKSFVFGGGGSDFLLTLPLWDRIWVCVLSIMSMVFISIVLVSMLTNTFGRIVDSYNNGDYRKSMKEFILIIGSGKLVKGVLLQAQKERNNEVVFAPQKPQIEGGSFILGNYIPVGSKLLISAIQCAYF